MVSRDGRVRVMDLGLVRRGDGTPDDPGPFAPPALSIQATRAGAVLGTPAYMAPEQFLGVEVGTAVDVFAYCVTFWEALYRQRPFAGDTFAELAHNVITGRMRGPPAGRHHVPGWLRRVLERGLHVDPAARWPGMEALLAELARGQSRARLRLAGVALGLLAVTAGAAWAWRQAAHDRRNAACEADGADIDSAWNDGTRDRVRAALAATGVRYATTTADHAVQWLDRHASTWRTARTESCRDADLREVWSPDALDRALWCLDERRMEFESLVDELARADAVTVQKAVSAAAGLEPVEPCRDADLLARLPVPPLEGRAEVREVRARLALASSHQAAGNYPAALVVAREALARAEALDWPPLVAAARQQVGLVLGRSGQYAEAEAAAEAAYFEAAEAGSAGVTAETAIELLLLVGVQRARHDDGHRWARLAHLALRILEPQPGLRTAQYLGNLAQLYRHEGQYPQARPLGEQALAIREQTLGPDHPHVAATLANLANVLRDTGDFAGALALDERAVAIREKALGPDHPELATNFANLANSLASTGDLAGGVAWHTRALQIREQALGPDHPEVASSLNNLAIMQYMTGAYAEAGPNFERALRIREAALGPEHPDVADSLAGIAALARDSGAYADARIHFRRALAITEATLGPGHTEVAGSLSCIGSA